MTFLVMKRIQHNKQKILLFTWQRKRKIYHNTYKYTQQKIKSHGKTKWSTFFIVSVYLHYRLIYIFNYKRSSTLSCYTNKCQRKVTWGLSCRSVQSMLSKLVNCKTWNTARLSSIPQDLTTTWGGAHLTKTLGQENPSSVPVSSDGTLRVSCASENRDIMAYLRELNVLDTRRYNCSFESD